MKYRKPVRRAKNPKAKKRKGKKKSKSRVERWSPEPVMKKKRTLVEGGQPLFI